MKTSIKALLGISAFGLVAACGPTVASAPPEVNSSQVAPPPTISTTTPTYVCYNTHGYALPGSLPCDQLEGQWCPTPPLNPVPVGIWDDSVILECS